MNDASGVRRRGVPIDPGLETPTTQNKGKVEVKKPVVETDAPLLSNLGQSALAIMAELQKRGIRIDVPKPTPPANK